MDIGVLMLQDEVLLPAEVVLIPPADVLLIVQVVQTPLHDPLTRRDVLYAPDQVVLIRNLSEIRAEIKVASWSDNDGAWLLRPQPARAA